MSRDLQSRSVRKLQICYFKGSADEKVSIDTKSTIARLRAVVQYKGYKYQINFTGGLPDEPFGSKVISKNEAMDWVQRMLLRSRGTELVRSFNPHLLASDHVGYVSRGFETFLDNISRRRAPEDVKARIWSSIMLEALEERRRTALNELEKLHFNKYKTVDIEKIVSACSRPISFNMEKVQQKKFVANVMTQVIERHITRGLGNIFSPLVVVNMSDARIEAIASERLVTKRQRVFLTDRIKKLEGSREISRDIMGSAFTS
ncbi:uncharacterized protein BCR38DRAFT_459082 [Pseudomassariella vexata]|uniref:GED domain-containing protein n=1 Tax=Pseudomassariella vexata TaxID=1141098 RepID=A0A1Y2DTQ1_9PEZI|nr:uncharacterized protein BCR38DRAFT_459082 [Pseudomassariella vexata]ORY62627.1 hypothetical protein BCR38DRAFT_459082 [Pseudomassariella vexata]